MDEAPLHQRFRRLFFRFNRWEEHFLEALRERVRLTAPGSGEPLKLLLCSRTRSSPRVQLMASRGCHRQGISLQIYGWRPVRYHIQTPNTPLGRALGRDFDHVLGAENLKFRSAPEPGEPLTLVYHVHYPDELLRRLEP